MGKRKKHNSGRNNAGGRKPFTLGWQPAEDFLAFANAHSMKLSLDRRPEFLECNQEYFAGLRTRRNAVMEFLQERPDIRVIAVKMLPCKHSDRQISPEEWEEVGSSFDAAVEIVVEREDEISAIVGEIYDPTKRELTYQDIVRLQKAAILAHFGKEFSDEDAESFFKSSRNPFARISRELPHIPLISGEEHIFTLEQLLFFKSSEVNGKSPLSPEEMEAIREMRRFLEPLRVEIALIRLFEKFMEIEDGDTVVVLQNELQGDTLIRLGEDGYNFELEMVDASDPSSIKPAF